MSSIATG